MVEIIKDWYFKQDEFQFILIHEYQKEQLEFGSKKPTGKFVAKREEVGYFDSLEGMLGRLSLILAKQKIDEGVVTTIGEYIAELRRISKELREMCEA